MAWAPDYVSASDLKSYVRIGDTDDDVQIGLAISAASRAVDRATHRQFGVTASAEDRYYTAFYDEVRLQWVVPIDDVQTSTGLTVAAGVLGSEVTITDYRKVPVNAAAEGKPWTELIVGSASATQPTDLEFGVKVHATFGWTAVPSAVKQATLLQASRFLTRRNSPYGIAGSPEVGSELRLLAKLDPDVEVALRDYRRPGWAFA